MSEIPRETVEPQVPDIDIEQYMPKKYIMSPVHFAASLVMKDARTYFEEGVRDDIREHREDGGSFLILMSHFRRWEPIVIAQVARVNPSLQHLQYNTGITAREDIFKLPVVGPIIVANSGAMPVDRGFDKTKEETPEEKEARKAKNQETQAIGGLFLEEEHDWLIYPEGNSKEILMKDGKPARDEEGNVIRKPRQPGKILQVFDGFVHSLKAMSPEGRAKVKLLVMALHYGDTMEDSSFHPTVAIPELVTPLDGDFETKAHQALVMQQGEDALRKGIDDAVAIYRGELATRSVMVPGTRSKIESVVSRIPSFSLRFE